MHPLYTVQLTSSLLCWFISTTTVAQTRTRALWIQKPQILWDYNSQAIYITNSPFVLSADSADDTVNSFTYFTWPAVVNVDDAVTDCDNWCMRDEAVPVRDISWVRTTGRVTRIEFWVAGCCQWWKLTTLMLQQLFLLQFSTSIALLHPAKAIFMLSHAP